MRIPARTVWAVTLLLTWGAAVLLRAQTSEDNPRLKKALQRFPQADANKDGILTKDEAVAFKEKHANRLAKGEATTRSAPAPSGGERRIYKRIDGIELPLYVFKPAEQKAGAKKPAIVFFFGGGWTSGTPTQFEPHCKYLAARGMVAVTVEYRVSSRHDVKIDDCIEDARSAMRWVRAHADELGVDPRRIAAGGGSAGGHLAACTAVMDDFNAATDDLKVSAKPNAMVLFNPALAIAPDDRMSEKYLARFRNRQRDRARAPAEKVSPLTYASTNQPPCIMFFGTEDGLLEGAGLYRKDSEKAGNVCKLVTYEGQRHSFFNYRQGDNKYYNLTLDEMDKFLVGLGWLSGNATP